MAYDPNDPKDKEIVDGLIQAALEEQREAHEAEVERLNNKNKDLLKKVAKAREGVDNVAEIERLERELDETKHELSEAQSNLRTTNRDLQKITGERDSAVKERDSEREFSRNELIENNLTAALVEHKVAPHFMDAARALLKGKAAVEVDSDGNRSVKADGKDVKEFVKEWAASDAGKHYIIAPGNAGGGSTGANGGGTPSGDKKLADMSETERLDMARTRPDEWKAKLAAESPPATPVIA